MPVAPPARRSPPASSAAVWTSSATRSRKRVPASPIAKPIADRVPQLPNDPESLVKIDGAIKVAGGLGLVFGPFARPAALLLAGSLVPTTLAGHRFWETTDPDQKASDRVEFFKNVSLIGGLLIAALDTGGRPSVPWRGRQGAARASARRSARRPTRSARVGGAAGSLAGAATAVGGAVATGAGAVAHGAGAATSKVSRRSQKKSAKDARRTEALRAVAAAQAAKAAKRSAKAAKRAKSPWTRPPRGQAKGGLRGIAAREGAVAAKEKVGSAVSR